MKSYFCIALILLALSIAQEISNKHSFIPPFDSYNWSGNRKIAGWKCGGDAMIKEYFIRLTPDRQSKRGYCWSDAAMPSDKWVTTIKFRISGQGEHVFGDGFSVFFVNKAYHEDGNMHGSNDKYVGFAVDFTTYKNQDYAQFHKDVSLYIGNNTSENAFRQGEYHPGCYANYRYHEKRQDFSVEKFAQVRISYDGTTQEIKVTIDSKGTNFYQSCISEVSALPADWWRTVHIGISASTGQVADNHDIISVETYVGTTTVPEKEVDALTEKQQEERLNTLLAAEGINSKSLDPKARALYAMVSELGESRQREVDKLKRSLEHSLTAIDDSINNMIRKLQTRGEVSENKIEELEDRLKDRVSSSISNQISARVAALERLLNANMEKEVKKTKGAWIVPFVLLVAVLGCVFFYIYKEYKHIVKKHML